MDIGLIVSVQAGETSLLRRYGLTATKAASDILVASEGAFGTHLLENDIYKSSLMFGKAGLLDAANKPCLTQPSLGFAFQEKPPSYIHVILIAPACISHKVSCCFELKSYL